MSKGYLIFIEGGNAPLVIHDEFQAVMELAAKHSRQNRGKEVMVLQIHKRMLTPVKAAETAEPEKLPTHLPSKEPGAPRRRLGFKDLVFREQAR